MISNKIPINQDLIVTKLEKPPVNAGVISRKHLTSLLFKGLNAKLTLLVAPAGYGKTTLLAEWINQRFPPGWRLGYISLDSYDNSLTRFWSYFFAAINKSYPGIRLSFTTLNNELIDSEDYSFLNPLINEVSLCSYPIFLVLDDYHLIKNERIHKSISYLIDHQPQNFHLAIVGRYMPPIALSRLRTQGHLVEILVKEIAFSYQEVQEYLTQIMDLDLNYSQISRLAELTQGWIAGLKLAAISIKTQPNMNNLFSEPSKSINWQIFDFLMEEVINNQEPEIKTFLLNTSILSEFTPALCDAIFDQENSLQILNQIIRDQLFIQSLDDQQNWHRYHHLFTETLRRQVQETAPETIEQIRRKAGTWLRENGYPDKAVSYSLEVGDLKNAAQTIDECAMEAVKQFNVAMLVQWINRLSPDLLKERPQLVIYEALANFLLGKLDQVKPTLHHLETLLKNHQVHFEKHGDENLIRWQISVLFTITECINGDIHLGINQIHGLLKDAPIEDTYFVGNMSHILAASYVAIGDLDTALAAFQNSMDFARDNGLVREFAYSLTQHAIVLKMQGKLTEAKQDYQILLNYTETYQLPLIFWAFAVSGLVDIAVERHQFETADRLVKEIEKNKEHLESAPPTWLRLEEIYLCLAKFYYSSQNYSRGDFYHKRVLDIIRDFPKSNTFWNWDLINLQILIWLNQNNHKDNKDERIDQILQIDPYHRAKIAQNIAFAFINFFDGSEPVSNLSTLLNEVNQKGFRIHTVQLFILKSELAFQNGNKTESANYLKQAILQAKGETILKPFIMAAQTHYFHLQEILDDPAVELNLEDENSLKFLKELNHTVNELTTYPKIQTISKEETSQTLIRPYDLLSSREKDVVELILQGRPSKEIALELSISANTLKTHMRKIFKKFEVHTKEEVIQIIFDERKNEFS